MWKIVLVNNNNTGSNKHISAGNTCQNSCCGLFSIITEYSWKVTVVHHTCCRSLTHMLMFLQLTRIRCRWERVTWTEPVPMPMCSWPSTEIWETPENASSANLRAAANKFERGAVSPETGFTITYTHSYCYIFLERHFLAKANIAAIEDDVKPSRTAVCNLFDSKVQYYSQ